MSQTTNQWKAIRRQPAEYVPLTDASPFEPHVTYYCGEPVAFHMGATRVGLTFPVEPMESQPKANCRNCGAANATVKCEYCGTVN